MSALHASQLELAHYLRDPAKHAAPAAIEPRRLKIYRELVYNNIESFISTGFPVLHSLYAPADWARLVRGFIANHRCSSPYFLEISQEFLQYILEKYQAQVTDPPFMAELAHYEWVELALDVSQEELPPGTAGLPILAAVPRLSPLAWVLRYNYPVHRVGPAFRPAEPGEPCYLAVYRNRDDAVKFMELNAATARLLDMTRDNLEHSAAFILEQLATELGLPADTVTDFGAQQLNQFAGLGVLVLEPA